MTDQTTTAPVRLPLSRRINLPVVTAFGCIVLLLAVGSLYSPNFLSPEYLLLQLKVGAFLGIIATGMMLVILLGQIDLSVPWTVTLGAMSASPSDADRTACASRSGPVSLSRNPRAPARREP